MPTNSKMPRPRGSCRSVHALSAAALSAVALSSAALTAAALTTAALASAALPGSRVCPLCLLPRALFIRVGILLQRHGEGSVKGCPLLKRFPTSKPYDQFWLRAMLRHHWGTSLGTARERLPGRCESCEPGTTCYRMNVKMHSKHAFCTGTGQREAGPGRRGMAHTASESDCGGTLRRSAVAACGLARARHRPCVYCPTAAALARLLSVGELSGKRCRLRACSRDRRCAYRHSHGSDVGSRPEVLATPPLAPQASISGTANECVYVKALASATDDTWRSFGRGPRPNDRERPAGQAPIDLPVKPQS